MIDFNLYLIASRSQVRRGSYIDAIKDCLDLGLMAIQVREKDMLGKELYWLAHSLRDLTWKYGAKLFINDRIDIALGVEADGVHLGQLSFNPKDARKLLKKGMMIGISTHTLDEARRAQVDGADFITFGPIYQSQSKENVTPLGIDALIEVVEGVDVPVLALGGITLDRVPEVMNTGATGVSLMSAILGKKNPGQETSLFLKRLSNRS